MIGDSSSTSDEYEDDDGSEEDEEAEFRKFQSLITSIKEKSYKADGRGKQLAGGNGTNRASLQEDDEWGRSGGSNSSSGWGSEKDEDELWDDAAGDRVRPSSFAAYLGLIPRFACESKAACVLTQLLGNVWMSCASGAAKASSGTEHVWRCRHPAPNLLRIFFA